MISERHRREEREEQLKREDRLIALVEGLLESGKHSDERAGETPNTLRGIAALFGATLLGLVAILLKTSPRNPADAGTPDWFAPLISEPILSTAIIAVGAIVAILGIILLLPPSRKAGKNRGNS